MAKFLANSFSGLTFEFVKQRREYKSQKLNSGYCRCVRTENKRRVVVKNGEDALDVCRVVNGMWQTSGGWGQINRDTAVDAMIKYADSGLDTFDMADICMQIASSLSCLL